MGGLLHLVQRGGVWALAHLTRKIVSEMTYNVSSGTLNTTILYYTITRAVEGRRLSYLSTQYVAT